MLVLEFEMQKSRTACFILLWIEALHAYLFLRL
jgi:hypothetical protein